MSELTPCTRKLLEQTGTKLTKAQKEYLAEHDLGSVFSCDRTTGEDANVPCLALIHSYGGVAARSCLLDSNEYAWQEELAGYRLTSNEVLRRVMSREGYKSVTKRP